MKTSQLPSRAGRIPAARRARLLAAFDRSGMSAAAFARQYKLNYTTFCGWRQQRAKSSPGFVQVEVSPPSAAAQLVIELGTAARMPIHCAGQIGLAAQLLQTLNTARPC